MTNTKLRPMRVNSNQIKRLLRGKIGDGFFVYRFDEDQVEVVEFTIFSDTGQLLQGDGEELKYFCKNGDTFRYRIVREQV